MCSLPKLDYYVYQLRVEGESDPFYVGKGIGNRAKQHLMPSNLDDSFKSNKIKKALSLGNAIQIEYIWIGLSEEDSLRREIWAIHLYGRRDRGEGCLTNLTDGGDGVSGLKQTAEAKEAVRRAQIGNTNRLGSKHRSDSIAKIQAAKLHISQETRSKMSLAKKGKSPGPELAKRRMEKLVGRKQQIVFCSYCGKKCSPATLSRWHGNNCKESI